MRRPRGSAPPRSSPPARQGRVFRMRYSKAASTTSRAGRRPPRSPALERHATSSRLIVDTKPGLGPVERADFRGNAHFVDGELTADAPRAALQHRTRSARSLPIDRRHRQRPDSQQPASHRAGAQHPAVAVDAEAQGRHRRSEHHQAAEACRGWRPGTWWTRGATGSARPDADAGHAEAGPAGERHVESSGVRRGLRSHLHAATRSSGRTNRGSRPRPSCSTTAAGT